MQFDFHSILWPVVNIVLLVIILYVVVKFSEKGAM